jgi:hypothetical protein
MHHTKEKGDLGVLKAQVDLFEQGFVVAFPMTEHAPFDLIIYKEGVCRTVQVKYRQINSDGTLEVHFKTSWADKNGVHEKPIDKDAIDIICIYCPDTGECYYFDPKLFNKSVSLRVNAPKNNQNLGIKLASDYRKVP